MINRAQDPTGNAIKNRGVTSFLVRPPLQYRQYYGREAERVLHFFILTGTGKKRPLALRKSFP
jgi:hypothetical protein